MDKFLLLKFIPWDETIFFDADTLAFGDLNDYWDVFKEATDFSSIGVNVGLNEGGAWYDVDGIGKYGELIAYKTRIHLGVAFIRRSASLRKLYDDCLDIYSNYNRLYIHTNPGCYDEVILGIAMPMNNMKAINEVPRMMACYPCLISVSGNMEKGTLSYATQWGTTVKDNGLLVHFGTANTIIPLYRYSAEWLNFYFYKSQHPSLGDSISFRWGARQVTLWISYGLYSSICFVKQLFRRTIKYFRRIFLNNKV